METLWIRRESKVVSRHAFGWQLGSSDEPASKGLDGKCTFATDEKSGFFRLLPEKDTFWVKTYHPGHDIYIRYRLARFKRKSKTTFQ